MAAHLTPEEMASARDADIHVRSVTVLGVKPVT
jgi:hypothetical protein